MTNDLLIIPLKILSSKKEKVEAILLSFLKEKASEV